MPETVAAVVVTHNRSKLLCECVASLVRQSRPLDGLYIIDNASTDGTYEALRSRGYLSIPTVNYIRLPMNTGGAGGFNEGMKRAFNDGYQWIWVMDDDAEAPPELCEQLLRTAFDRQAAVICPLIARPDATIENYHHKLLKFGVFTFREISAIPGIRTLDDQCHSIVSLDANAFVGPLISRDVIAVVGLPNSALFIHGDDTDYTYRANTHGFSVLLTTDVVIYHKDKQAAENEVLTSDDYWKKYHFVKNRIYFLRRYLGFISAILYAVRICASFLSPNTNIALYKIKIRAVVTGFRISTDDGDDGKKRRDGAG